MIKIVNTIVDSSYRLIGVMCEGRGRDFGDMSNEKITKPVTMQYMFKSNFSNKQVAFKNGGIIEKVGFKLNSLPMLMLTDTGYTPVDNTITLKKRYVQDNENVGFDVDIGGVAAKFTYENVVRLTSLFRPSNFVIRSNQSDYTKKFIAGKTGSSLSDLPVEVIGEASNAKKTKPGTKRISKVTGAFSNNVDIMDLYDFIREANGVIINLPGTRYKATTESSATAEQFIQFNIGEIGAPWLDFNETKLNVSCNFKKPGAVAIKLSSGKLNNVITFVYRRKNIFYDCSNHIEKLGVVVPASAESELLNRFGASMSFTEITEPGMVRPVSMLIAQTNIKIYEVDTSKIGIIADSKLDSFILDNNTIYKYVSELTISKLKLKYLNGFIKFIKECGVVIPSEGIKDIAPQFAAMSNEDLVLLEENGIDIHSGAFMLKDTTKTTGKKSDDTAVEIGYAIDGVNVNSFTYKQLAECGTKVPMEVVSLVNKFTSIDDVSEAGALAVKTAEHVEATINKIKRVLWMHKCAMFIKSNKAGVHSHDKKCWELNTKKRTKAKCYNCTTKGCESLQLLLLNTDIK